jgi:hypothetical protein
MERLGDELSADIIPRLAWSSAYRNATVVSRAWLAAVMRGPSHGPWVQDTDTGVRWRAAVFVGTTLRAGWYHQETLDRALFRSVLAAVSRAFVDGGPGLRNVVGPGSDRCVVTILSILRQCPLPAPPLVLLKVTPQAQLELERFSSLTDLTVSYTTPEAVEHLDRLLRGNPKLERLTVQGVHLGSSAAILTSRISTLRVFGMSWDVARHMPHLTRLDTDAEVGNMPVMPRLTWLVARNPGTLVDLATKLPALESFTSVGGTWDQLDLVNLPALPALRVVDGTSSFAHCHHPGSPLGGLELWIGRAASTLWSLHLQDCSIGAQDGQVRQLARALGGCQCLRDLCLQQNCIGKWYGDTAALIQSLSNLPSLQVISLGENQLGKMVPLTSVVSWLLPLPALVRLELGGNAFGCLSTCPAVPLCPSLEILHLQRNHLSGAADVRYLGAILTSAPNIHTLDLYDNDLCGSSLGSFPVQATNHPSLRELDLGQNYVRGPGLDCVRHLLRRRKLVHPDYKTFF